MAWNRASRRPLALSAGLILFFISTPQRAEIANRQDLLFQEVQSQFLEAAETSASDPASAEATLEVLAERHPAQLATSLLEFVACVDRDSSGAPGRPARERFARTAAAALARRAGEASLLPLVERYLAGGGGAAQRLRDLVLPPGSDAAEATENVSSSDPTSSEAFRQTLRDVKKAGDSVSLSRLLMERGEERLSRGEWTGATDDFHEASEAAQSAHDAWFAMRARAMQGKAELEAGDSLQALIALEDAAELADRAGDGIWRAEALRGAGKALLELARPQEAIDRLQDAAGLLQDSPLERDRKLILSDLASAYVESAREAVRENDLGGAEELVNRGLQVAREASDELAASRLHVIQGDLLLDAGKREQAVALMRAALDSFRQGADDEGMVSAASRLGELLAGSLPGEAVGLFREAAEAASAMVDDERVGDLLARSAELARLSGLRREATKSLRIALSSEWGPVSLETSDKLHLTAGNLALQERKTAEALASYSLVKGKRSIVREARWGEGVSLLRLGRPELAAEPLLEAMPLAAVPQRALAQAALLALERAGRSQEAEELAGRLGSLLSDGGSQGGEQGLALDGLLAARQGRRSQATEAASRLERIETKEALYDAAGLFAALEMRERSQQVLARARRLGLDPVLPFLDALLEP